MDEQRRKRQFAFNWRTEATQPQAGEPACWWWDYLIREKGITLLAGAPKAGKSTLLRGLLSCSGRFLDRGVGNILTTPSGATFHSRVRVITEEEPEAWWPYPPGVSVHHHTSAPVPLNEWDSFIEQLAGDEENTATFIVIDSMARVWGGNESNPDDVRRVFPALRQAIHAESGERITWLLLHHAVKYGDGVESVRGSGEWAAGVDHVLRLDLVSGVDDPRRVLHSVGRNHAGRVPTQVIPYALTADGSFQTETPPQHTSGRTKAGGIPRFNGRKQ